MQCLPTLVRAWRLAQVYATSWNRLASTIKIFVALSNIVFSVLDSLAERVAVSCAVDYRLCVARVPYWCLAKHTDEWTSYAFLGVFDGSFVNPWRQFAHVVNVPITVADSDGNPREKAGSRRRVYRRRLTSDGRRMIGVRPARSRIRHSIVWIAAWRLAPLKAVTPTNNGASEPFAAEEQAPLDDFTTERDPVSRSTLLRLTRLRLSDMLKYIYSGWHVHLLYKQLIFNKALVK